MSESGAGGGINWSGLAIKALLALFVFWAIGWLLNSLLGWLVVACALVGAGFIGYQVATLTRGGDRALEDTRAASAKPPAQLADARPSRTRGLLTGRKAEPEDPIARRLRELEEEDRQLDAEIERLTRQ